ncbi:transmembrane protein 68 [Lingula anatina]|uniref:Transmembrane protein 68 n=1 Tax=Lingula anatina TaxID=7574 RepID=A0A1S3H8W6_LINAN|nr:transmembrane protein 68 [Lingula anatina]|eukprot:XP_013382530.1 transmembrane protein 68 [Lingula anatina]
MSTFFSNLYTTAEVYALYLWGLYKLDVYFDIDYLRWLAWLWYPIIISFLLPLMIIAFLYASALFLHIYRLRHQLKDAYSQDFWNGARKTLAALWDAQGYIWHGYEVIGLDKIPSEGPALLVYYHGAIPIDIYYLIAKCILHKNRQLQAVGDRFLFHIPGWKLLMEVFCVQPGTVQSGIDLMKQGQLLAIAPGGVREAYFSDEFYGLQWGKRTGFAKIAVHAQVPIIPMFTQNCREAFRSLGLGKDWLRRIYERTRLPLVPIYGGFPVKMRTIIGDPIPYDPNLSVEQVAKKVHTSIESLIVQHQKVPGNILRALLERLFTPKIYVQES